MRLYFIVLLLVLLFIACDGGLAPSTSIESGFSGTIYFAKNTWPPKDSLFNLWLFASKNIPSDSESIFFGILAGTIYFYPSFTESLPLKPIDSLSYEMHIPADVYQYVGVIQQFDSVLAVQQLSDCRHLSRFIRSLKTWNNPNT